MRPLPTALLAVVAALPLRAQTIDTRGNANWNFQTNTGIIGQSFTAPAVPGIALTDFILWPGRNGAEPPAAYRARVYAFSDGTTSWAVGPALYTSDVRTASSPNASGSPETFTAGTLRLSPGATYIALLQRSAPGDLVAGFANQGWVDPVEDMYPGGRMYLGRSWAADATTVDYRTWFASPDMDLMFVAHFTVSTVPEPGSVVLLAGALAAAAIVRRGRRRGGAAPRAQRVVSPTRPGGAA